MTKPSKQFTIDDEAILAQATGGGFLKKGLKKIFEASGPTLDGLATIDNVVETIDQNEIRKEVKDEEKEIHQVTKDILEGSKQQRAKINEEIEKAKAL